MRYAFYFALSIVCLTAGALLAFDHDGMLYISSRSEGSVYQSTPDGHLSVYVEGMGIGTGLAFDREDNLYVGDRSGTVFRVRGHGVPRLGEEGPGDLFVTIRVDIPGGIDARTEELVRELERLMPGPPREDLGRYRGGAA